jgi:hypothetical protein
MSKIVGKQVSLEKVLQFHETRLNQLEKSCQDNNKLGEQAQRRFNEGDISYRTLRNFNDDREKKDATRHIILVVMLAIQILVSIGSLILN